MRLLFVFAPCFLIGALLMAQGQPTPDRSNQVRSKVSPTQTSSAQATSTQATSVQDRNKAVAMRVFDEIFNQGKF